MILNTLFSKNNHKWLYTFMIIFIVIVGITASIYIGFMIHVSKKNLMTDRVQTLAQIIKADDIKFLKGDLTDLENSHYIDIKDLLFSVREINHDIRFIYINGIKDGQMFFFVDSEPSTSPDYSPPGEVYPDATPLMFEVFTKKKEGFEIAKDQWGLWVSTYVPIVNKDDGVVIGSIGLDVPGWQYIFDIGAYSGLPILVSLIMVLVLSFSRSFANKERKYLDEKAEFVFIASHEIRTPLTGIRWATENLLTKNKDLLDDYSRNTIQIVHNDSVNLINRVNNLLSLSTFSSEKNKADKKDDISLRPLFEDILKNINLTALSKNITLEIENNVSGISLKGNSDQIRQVFSNLISNAIKYGKVNSKINISYSNKDGHHRISVKDEGIGISPDEVAHIFEGYHRTSEAKKSNELGTGLGLYLSQKIMTEHGGQIEVNSKFGVGSEFIVVLPA
ncbi:MAG: HAMP domain-containing sensor histidine kinase [bacterium]|nr:HAMP domain-containing sensor histidine kinase [bacterium]